MEHFEGRVAVITGAGSGFGREFARVAAGLGMKLVLADIDAAALEQVSGALRDAGADVLAMVCDVSKASHVEELADAAMIRFDGVHLVFNNAGVAMAGLVWESTDADWQWVLGVNLWGAIHGVRVFTPLMLECARREPDYEGHIVNTASMAGLLVPPAMGVYNVSKHAVVALSETLYHDLRLVDAPVKASVLCPYFVPTDIAHSERHRPDDLRHDGTSTPSQARATRCSNRPSRPARSRQATWPASRSTPSGAAISTSTPIRRPCRRWPSAWTPSCTASRRPIPMRPRRSTRPG